MYNITLIAVTILQDALPTCLAAAGGNLVQKEIKDLYFRKYRRAILD